MTRCYVFKKWFLWIGWIYSSEDVAESKLYSDNSLTEKIVSAGVIFLTFALSEKTAVERIVKYLKKRGMIE